MVFVPKLWKDLPDQSTPLTAAAMIDLESRLAAYAESQPLAVVNVKTYGAIGNGVADDTTAVQAAVTACAAAGGGTVYFPSGIYNFFSALSVPNFVCLQGDGQATKIVAVGNVFAINLNPANRVRISNLAISAASVQSSGGGIDYTNAANNVWLQDIWFGSNLFIGLNMRPAAQGGHFHGQRLRWNGVASCNTAIMIGDGTNLVSNVYLSHCTGTCVTAADMPSWLTVLKNVDTLQIDESLFASGMKGMTLGASGSGDVTNCKFTSLVFDSALQQGIDIRSCRGMTFANCNVQGCGTTVLPGLDIGPAAKDVAWVGGDIHENRKDGV